MIQLREHFRHDDRSRHSDWLRRQQWFIKARRNHARKEDLAEKQADESLSFAVETVMVTQIQIEQFEARLDVYEARLNAYETKLNAYDLAITKALIENAERMSALMLVREELLANAYVLEDGSRVFKSEDGSFVVDENGELVSSEIINPNDIPDYFTKAEPLLGNNKDIELTSIQKAQLHDVERGVRGARNNILETERAKLGVMRDRVKAGDVTVEEIESWDADTLATTPLSLPTLPPFAAKFLSSTDTADAPDVKQDFSTNADSPKVVTSPVISVSKFEPGG